MSTVHGVLSPHHLEAGALPGRENISEEANWLLMVMSLWKNNKGKEKEEKKGMWRKGKKKGAR